VQPDGAAWRSVPLDPETVATLREHREAQAVERELFGSDYGDGDLVFCREDGSPLNPHAFTEAFDRYVKASKLPRIRLHDLRHTWATLALQSGIHPKVVSEILGHSSIAITLDTYSHAIPTMQETAVDLVAALVQGSGHEEPREPVS
jgi:integrase